MMIWLGTNGRGSLPQCILELRKLVVGRNSVKVMGRRVIGKE